MHALDAAAKLAVLPLCNVTAKVSALMLAPMGIPTMSLAMMPQVLVGAVVVDSPSVCA